ncbi:MAG: LysR family transcriptional regulator [Deltaproteobacteria bacterium]|nr:LysR family transcriptional regulator [Deltaproteobacteria bacterium]
MINLNQLRAFYEVARSLNFSVAAENLYVSQPAVTKQIKLFESSWNLKLFHKKRGKLFLTEEGKKIFVYASRIFELERQLEDTISGIQNLKQGSLRIGTTKTYARFFMPRLLAPFQRSFPDIIIELDEGSSLDMEKSLLDLKNSLAIVARVEENPDILFTPIMLEEVVLIMSPKYHLAGYDTIPFKDLEGEPVVMKELGSGTRKIVEQWARDEKITLNIIAQTSNMDFIKQLVGQSRGISFVVKSSVEEELSRGDLASIPIKGEKLMLDICIARLRDYELPLAAKRFLDFLLSVARRKRLPVGIRAFIENLPREN